jgi:hypothetical protein
VYVSTLRTTARGTITKLCSTTGPRANRRMERVRRDQRSHRALSPSRRSRRTTSSSSPRQTHRYGRHFEDLSSSKDSCSRFSAAKAPAAHCSPRRSRDRRSQQPASQIIARRCRQARDHNVRPGREREEHQCRGCCKIRVELRPPERAREDCCIGYRYVRGEERERE